MARHGENIRKRSDGRWEGRYPAYSQEKGRTVYHSVYGKSYEEAKERLNAKKQGEKEEKQAEQSGRIRNIAFAAAAEEWKAQLAMKRKPSTCVKYQLIYRKYLALPFGEADVADISDRLLRERLPEDLSESLQKSIQCVINQILAYASGKYGIPVQRVKRQASKVKRRPVEVLTKREQTRLLSVLYSNADSYKMAAAICLYTGLRIGEACALRWADIDFENRLLYVNRTVQRIGVNGRGTRTQLMETAPKSEYSKREIPISSLVWELLVKLKHQKSYVFGGDKPMEPRTLQYRFKKLLMEAEIPDKGFHILRHTFATNCIEGGVDIKSLSELLGHSDVQITLNRYVHPPMSSKRRQMEELKQIYGQIYGQAV